MAESPVPATQVSSFPPVTHRWSGTLPAFRDVVWPLLAYIVATFATRSYFMGDTIDYADSIAARFSGKDYYFWEFGHLLWRPAGYLIFKIFHPLLIHFVGLDTRLQATLVLMILSWLAGLLSVFSLHCILGRICRKRWVVIITTIAFIFALAFLNYFHSGAPYVPGLSLVLLSLCILNTAKPGEPISFSRSLLAAITLAGAVCTWFPYVVVAPAVTFSPGFLQGFDKRRFAAGVQTLFVAGVLTLMVYLVVCWQIGVHSLSEFKVWLQMTSGDAASTPNKGITRTVFGFARAFVSMENEGVLFKRYLLHDPFNPVSFLDLAKLSLWKIIGFYLFLSATILSLLSFLKGRRILLLLALAGIPALAFAIYWQGGDPERYLALFPFVMLAVGVALDENKHAILSFLILLFLMGASALNVALLASPRLNRKQELSASRVRDLLPQLKSESLVLTANWQDELINFNRTFPFNPVNQDQNLHIAAVITPGAPDVARWRQGFLKGAESTWDKGGDVWLSKRLLASRPKAEWNWVEGDNPQISWTHLFELFSRLRVGQTVGGEDGFVLLLSSEQNKDVLRKSAQQ